MFAQILSLCAVKIYTRKEKCENMQIFVFKSPKSDLFFNNSTQLLKSVEYLPLMFKIVKMQIISILQFANLDFLPYLCNVLKTKTIFN